MKTFDRLFGCNKVYLDDKDVESVHVISTLRRYLKAEVMIEGYVSFYYDPNRCVFSFYFNGTIIADRLNSNLIDEFNLWSKLDVSIELYKVFPSEGIEVKFYKDY